MGPGAGAGPGKMGRLSFMDDSSLKDNSVQILDSSVFRYLGNSREEASRTLPQVQGCLLAVRECWCTWGAKGYTI